MPMSAVIDSINTPDKKPVNEYLLFFLIKLYIHNRYSK